MKFLITKLAFLFICTTSLVAQTALVPIADMRLAGLMGGVQNGRWVASEKATPKVKSETEFVLIGINGVEEGAVTLGKKGAPGDPCQDMTPFEFDLEQDSGIAIGSGAKWNFVPRIPKPIDLNSAIYKTVVTNFLKRKGISRPMVSIKEAVRVDLEGDGTEEVLLSATHYKGGMLHPSAAPGDYSFVILRKAVGKVVTDHMLDGEFYLKNVEFGAPNEHHLSAIADLNGDGKMEVVIRGFYYEGAFASAFEMKNGRPVRIKELDIGCGA